MMISIPLPFVIKWDDEQVIGFQDIQEWIGSCSGVNLEHFKFS